MKMLPTFKYELKIKNGGMSECLHVKAFHQLVFNVDMTFNGGVKYIENANVLTFIDTAL